MLLSNKARDDETIDASEALAAAGPARTIAASESERSNSAVRGEHYAPVSERRAAHRSAMIPAAHFVYYLSLTMYLNSKFTFT